MINDWIEMEVLELEGTAEWRGRKAQEYPNDRRNAEAAAMASKLAEQLRARSNETSEIAAKFLDLHDFIFQDGDADEDSTSEVVRRWLEYRSRIGFSYFPDTAAEYLNDLIEIASDASLAAVYLTEGPDHA